MGLVGISVIFSTEIPLLRHRDIFNQIYLHRLLGDRWLFVPHAIGGVIATVLGPLQFSSRLRARSLTLHRWLGRVYVYAIFIAGPAAILIQVLHRDPLLLATIVQAGAWMLCTGVAVVMARNGHIAQHRQWMIRSYAVTFTFLSTRALNFIPAWLLMDAVPETYTILIFTLLSGFVIPDIAFQWREITRSRRA
jgi:uncharacterized membrane protein